MNISNKSRSYRWFIVFPCIAAGLGTWQVYRYHWKKDLIDKAKENVSKDPIRMNENVVKALLSTKDSITVGANQLEFRRVGLKGHYVNPEENIQLGPRTNDGNVGYYLITPFKIESDAGSNSSNDTTVLVNRGWIPSYKLKSNNEKNKNITSQLVEIEGLIGKSRESGSMFTPDNQPEKNQWYYINAEEMAKTSGASAPIVVNTIDETFTGDKQLTRDFNTSLKRFNTDIESNFYNKHMTYIFTWYTLSGCLSLIYYKYMRPLKK